MDSGKASDLVLGLLKGVPSELFSFKKVQADGSVRDYPIRVKLLRLEQNHQVLRDAQAYAKRQGEAPGDYGDIYREAQAVELLTLALCHVEDKTLPDGSSYFPPLFTDAQQLRASFTAPEMAQCLNMYELVKGKYGAIESFREEELELWRERLADTMRGPFFLSLLDSAHWPQLIFALAKEARDLRQQLGLPLSTSLDSLASDPSISTSSTGSFSELPQGQSQNGELLPTDHIMTAEEAKERSKRITNPQK
jgi:hypothetical protein